MKHREIKNERIRNYFIQSAKKIICENGLKNLNVRRIAEAAGYSHTTMYNYFQNLDELLCCCIVEFQQEVSDYVSGTEKTKDEKKNFINTVLAIAEYFIKNPTVFRLIFLYEFEDIDNPGIKMTPGLIEKMKSSPAVAAIYRDLTILADKKIIHDRDIMLIGTMTRKILTGAVLFHINRRFPSTDMKDFKNDLQAELLYLIRQS